MTIEFWTAAASHPLLAASSAVDAEADGWDGISYAENHGRVGDVYVSMALAAAATDRIKLAPGVTNSITRHAGITANAISAVHIASGGRAELGIGRGDSALATFGRKPADVEQFSRYLRHVGMYLRGEPIPMEEFEVDGARPIPADERELHAPDSSRLDWLADSDLAPPPVWVTASGPKVIRAAAEHADRVEFAIGADPDRIKWGIEVARELSPTVRFGAFVNIVVDDDVTRAFELASETMTFFARFSVMQGLTGPATADDRQVFERARSAFAGNGGGSEGPVMTEDFAMRYGIIGPASHCRERLLELHELGIDVVHVIPGASRGGDPEVARASRERFIEDVREPLRAYT